MSKATNRCRNCIVCSHFPIRIAQYTTNSRVNRTMPTTRHWPLLAKPPELATIEVHVWAVPLTVSQQAYENLRTTLAPDECARADDFHFEEPRRRYVIARGTLRRLLGHYLDLQPTQVELAINRNKKPRLAAKDEPSGLHFNVSHSGDLVVIAFAFGCEVGIDVEQLREVGHMEQIAKRFFHPSEMNAVLSAPKPARNLAFLRCWTGKEAILKALGTGIVGNLAHFQVPTDSNWQGWVECAAALPHGQRSRCWLEQLSPCDNYVASIACVESKRSVRSYTLAM
jgi:4'-phosphopantetheinyl transferase